ncbi:helix-turn-helix domain-containing protein [Pseudodesulfovibrio tunisiensis]|uniref:helix-turn-helix domain-containing protein n=1 Tax=Pseudodesulfovibrio tunisiensis TaxID=463192 RepID=UPI001FB267DC|nr:helix-turn-helix domain-containing protein [Pseudodesulfovibrio tunisiensis]
MDKHDTSRTPKLLTVREVADLLRVHPRTAYRLVSEGSIGAIKIGTQWRVPESALMEYIERGLRESSPGRKKRDKDPRQYKLPME